MSFARKLGDICGKKLMETATKTGIDAAKTASKRVVQKTAEATGHLTENKIADKVTSIGKPSKAKQKKNKQSRINLHSTRKKDNMLLMILNCFEHKMKFYCIKMEFQKIANFLDTTLNDKKLPKFATKKWIEVYDQSEKIAVLTKKLESKRQC